MPRGRPGCPKRRQEISGYLYTPSPIPKTFFGRHVMTDSYRGLQFHVNLPRLALQKLRPSHALKMAASSLKLTTLSIPENVQEPTWIPLRPILSGICGSDISLLRGTGSPYLAPLVSLPAVLGHEVVAQVDTSSAPWPRGTRVVVNPSLSCSSRHLPLCPACKRGEPDECARRADPLLGPGLILGYNRNVPGSWATRMWAPADQVMPIPDRLDDRRAVLAEPASIVWQALSRIRWKDVSSLLIIGAGTIGLLTAWLARIKAPHCQIFVRARYAHQAHLAKQLGPFTVYRDHNDRAFVTSPELDDLAGAVLPRVFGGWPYRTQGFDAVVDSVGNQHSLYQSLTLTRPGGQILLLGGASKLLIDLTPVWSRRISLYGSFGYGHYPATASQTFSEVIRLLNETQTPIQRLVTHVVSLENYREALKILGNRHAGAIKVVFSNPDGPGK